MSTRKANGHATVSLLFTTFMANSYNLNETSNCVVFIFLQILHFEIRGGRLIYRCGLYMDVYGIKHTYAVRVQNCNTKPCFCRIVFQHIRTLTYFMWENNSFYFYCFGDLLMHFCTDYPLRVGLGGETRSHEIMHNNSYLLLLSV